MTLFLKYFTPDVIALINVSSNTNTVPQKYECMLIYIPPKCDIKLKNSLAYWISPKIKLHLTK